MPQNVIGDYGSIRKGIRWLIYLRFLGVIGGFIVVAVHAGNLSRTSSQLSFIDALGESGLLFAFLSIVALFNGVCLATCRKIASPERFVLIQLFTDIFLLAILIYLTGGPGSIFTHFNFAVILAASLLGTGRSSLVCAGLSSFFLLIIISLFAILPGDKLPLFAVSWYVERSVNLNFFVSYLFIPSSAFFLVAILSNILSVRIGTLRLVNDQVLRTMAEAVIICDKNHQIILFNMEARKLFGFSDDRELEGESVEAVFKRDTDHEFVSILTTAREIHREVVLVRRNEEVQPLEVKTSIIHSYKDQPIAVVCLLSDLTLRRVLEEADRKIERLEGIRQMSSGIAQELRQPISELLSAIPDLQDFTSHHRKAKEIFYDMVSNLKHLETMTNEFSDFSKKGELYFVRTNLAKLILDIGESLLEQFAHLDKYKIQYDLPSELYCECDGEQIKRVLHHICLNAFEAMPDGGRLLIRGQPNDRESSTTGGMVEGNALEFYDEGNGIPEGLKEKIYDPFYGTKKRNAGLGLSVASRVLRAHGGEINFESKVGYGTTFSIWIPSAPRPKGPGEDTTETN